MKERTEGVRTVRKKQPIYRNKGRDRKGRAGTEDGTTVKRRIRNKDRKREEKSKELEK